MKTHIKPLLFLPLLIVVLELISSGRVAAQSFTNLHSLSWVDVGNGYTNNDGDSPYTALVVSGSKLYGTAGADGPGGGGTVFALNTDGSGFTNLFSFGHDASLNFTNGSGPQGAMVLSGSRLFGTTTSGGASGNGTVFAINTDGSSFTNLHKFSARTSMPGPYGTNYDGAEPQDALILSGSTLYGTTQIGGTNSYGTIFAVNTDGSGFTVLHHFTAASGTTGNFGANSDGIFPRGGLVLAGGTLYGTAIAGGTNGYGTVFAVNTDGTGFNVLRAFTAPDFTYNTNLFGSNPAGGLVASGSVLYGRTSNGAGLGYGAVFAVHTDGTGFTNIYNFTNAYSVTVGSAGMLLSGTTLYGTASFGGNLNSGTVFSLNTDGTGFKILHLFTPALSSTNVDGSSPYGGVVSAGGVLYGTTRLGGTAADGAVYALNPTAPPPPIQFTVNSSVGTVPSVIQFSAPAYDNGGFPLTNWVWNFGDGGTSTNHNPTHLYSATGTFIPTLVATNIYRVTVAATGPVITIVPPFSTTGYSATPTNGRAPLSVQFNAPGTDDGGYTITGWHWDFGDGSTSTDQNPSHLYAIGGIFAPTLVTTNSFGGTDTGYGPTITVLPEVSAGHTNVLYYTFEDDNIFAQDFSGHGNGVHGVSYFSDTNNEPYVTNDAVAGAYAMGYDGSGWQDPPTNLVAALAGSFSVSLWAKTSQNPAFDSATADQGAGLVSANSDLAVPMALTGHKLAFLTGGASPDTLHSMTSINTGSYVHLVVTRDQTTGEKKIYVNGNLDASDVGSAGQLNTSGMPQLYLGENVSFSGGFVGEMDEVQIYSGVLSSNEVGYLYAHPGTNIADVVGQGGVTGVDIVSNGGFETGDFSGWMDDGSGSVGTDPDYVHSGNYGASFGAVGQLGYCQQTLNTTPGTTYLLSLWLDSPDGDTPNEFQVSWGGNVLLDETDLPAFGWTNIQLVVTATDTTTVLQFGLRDDPTELGLDDVSVVSISAPPPAPVSVSFNLQIQRYQDFSYGYTNYDVYPEITFVDPAPVTTNSIISPDGFMFSEVWTGDSSQDSQNAEGFSTLDDLMYACTNSPWTVYINRGDPSEQVFHFNVTMSGLNPDVLPSINILEPVPNAINVPTNSPVEWSGPADYSSMYVEAYQFYPSFVFDGFIDLPTTASSWPSPPALVVGTNYLYVTYTSNNFAGVTFTTPVNDSLATVSNWQTEVDLNSASTMTFVVGGSQPSPALLGSLQAAGGSFQFSFLTHNGLSETIQTTTNLNSAWTDVTNFTGDGSAQQFIFRTTNAPAKFYRVKTQ